MEQSSFLFLYLHLKNFKFSNESQKCSKNCTKFRDAWAKVPFIERNRWIPSFTGKLDNLERQLPFWPGKCFMIKLLSVNSHRVKSVRIRSYSVPYFPAFGMHTKRYGVYLSIQSECGKIRTRITPNTDTFHAVSSVSLFS